MTRFAGRVSRSLTGGTDRSSLTPYSIFEMYTVDHGSPGDIMRELNLRGDCHTDGKGKVEPKHNPGDIAQFSVSKAKLVTARPGIAHAIVAFRQCASTLSQSI